MLPSSFLGKNSKPGVRIPIWFRVHCDVTMPILDHSVSAVYSVGLEPECLQFRFHLLGFGRHATAFT